MAKESFFDNFSDDSSSEEDEQKNEGFASTKKPGLYDYIDSIGKIYIEREDKPKRMLPRISSLRLSRASNEEIIRSSQSSPDSTNAFNN